MRNTFYHPMPMPDFSSAARNVAWVTDFSLPSLLEETYQAVISNNDDRPYVEVAYDALSDIVNYDKRHLIAYELKKRLIDYLKTRYVEEDKLKQISVDLDSLIHYLDFLHDLADFDKNIQKLFDDNPQVPQQRKDAIVYYFALCRKDGEDEFLYFSQAHFHFAHVVKKSIESTILPIYAYSFKDRFAAYPATVFCLSLLEAMHFINRVQKRESSTLPTVKDFPIKLRNDCFDKYVEHQTKEMLKILSQNNDQKEVPSYYDAKYEVYTTEKEVLADKESDDINPEAFKMAQYLLERIKDDLEIEDDLTAESQPYCTYIMPNAPKPREEIEADIKMASTRSAQRFANRLLALERLEYLNFLGDTPREIYDYLKARYNLPYSAENFIKFFKPE